MRHRRLIGGPIAYCTPWPAAPPQRPQCASPRRPAGVLRQQRKRAGQSSRVCTRSTAQAVVRAQKGAAPPGRRAPAQPSSRGGSIGGAQDVCTHPPAGPWPAARCRPLRPIATRQTLAAVSPGPSSAQPHREVRRLPGLRSVRHAPGRPCPAFGSEAALYVIKVRPGRSDTPSVHGHRARARPAGRCDATGMAAAGHGPPHANPPRRCTQQVPMTWRGQG